ncbi:hypothetical protein SAMN05443549_10485 [Flavobacterium fluvii]|uniref:Uncharacterized protein n=1 Tax=Flavobacterium fluvii TaxID=468056 RepID=A0A1M5JUT6_9FLAO|nr:hypothetical protein [Flavobacterium fluvii]SHG44372.1 hypothetical protein SAMN05443549_10485 [Flavobacterium fluvii]
MKTFLYSVLFLGGVFHYNVKAQSSASSDASVLTCQIKENPLYQQEKDRIYQLIEKQVHHLRGGIQNWKGDSSMKLMTKSGSGEASIRPNAAFAASMSFLYRFGKFDPATVGLSKKEMLQNEIIPMIRYLVRTHRVGDLKTDDGKAWGDAWQSALWVSLMGNAAWYVWDELPSDIQQGARNVVAHEADRIAAGNPPHKLKLDSKSEENSWNSQVISAALFLMPNDSRYAKWEKALQKWAMSSYLRPADSSSTAIVDQIPVSKQFNGANIYDDFTLENHDIVHPDYMGAWIQNAENDVYYLLSGRKPLQAFLYNLPQIYKNQMRLFLPDGGYCYPSGQDWAIFRNADWMPSHATAVARFNDPEAVYFLRAGLETAEKMQQRNQDGAIYAPGENYFASAQGHLSYWLAQAWLELQFAQKELKPVMQKPGTNYFVDGKFLINRTKNAFHSISWGEKIMIQLMPLAKDHIVSPDQRNGIGSISVNDTVQRVVLKSVDVKETKNSFVVNMVVQHGKYIQAAIRCESKPNGQLTISEKLTALQDCTTNSVGTLSFGILNNPNWVYEKGSRTLKLDQQESNVKAASGQTNQAVAKSVKVDNLNFDLGSQSNVIYKAATKMKDSRHTDLLVLNAIKDKHEWKQGNVISENKVTISVK